MPFFEVRLVIIVRSDSEILTFIFETEKRIVGLLMEFDFTKSDGIKSGLRIRWPKSSDLAQNPKTRPIGWSIRKMAWVFGQV